MRRAQLVLGGSSPSVRRPSRIVSSKAPGWTAAFSETLIELAAKRRDIVAITAAMPGGTGIDLFGNTGSGSIVHRTRDAAAATAMVQTIAGKNPAVAGIPQLPTVKCMTGGELTYCWIPVGRYVASVYDSNASVARQKAAAQFSILATTP